MNQDDNTNARQAPRSPWAAVQYRGDAADIQELYQEYNVGGYLSTQEAGIRQWGSSLRDRLLKDGVLLNHVISPRIYRIVAQVQGALGLEGEFEVFCGRSVEVNAFAHLDLVDAQPRHIIGITSAALENLEDDEIAFLLGHELGHFIFGHNRLLGLLNQDPQSNRITVLPYLGECLFLRWRKKSEVSADRLGLVAAKSFTAGARALVKAGFGLSDRNLDLNVDSLLRQVESIKDKPEIVEAAYRSHPLLPLRLKALHLFAETAGQDPAAAASARVDDEIDALFDWFRRYPRQRLPLAVMRLVAIAGMQIVGVEHDVDDEEIRTIIYLLHANFTDTPEAELVLDEAERKRRWDESLAVVREEGGDAAKAFIIARLADIALADGKLLDQEAGIVLETAEALGVPARAAYGIIVEAAQTVGFKVDYQMKEIMRRVRSQMMGSVAGPAQIVPPLGPI